MQNVLEVGRPLGPGEGCSASLGHDYLLPGWGGCLLPSPQALLGACLWGLALDPSPGPADPPSPWLPMPQVCAPVTFPCCPSFAVSAPDIVGAGNLEADLGPTLDPPLPCTPSCPTSTPWHPVAPQHPHGLPRPPMASQHLPVFP